MRIGVLGINHKFANVNLREQLAKACRQRFVLGGSCDEEHTFVLLSTCNRTEVYFSSEDLANTHSCLLQFLRQDVKDEFDQKIYSFFGTDCFLHLARVTAGLDSAIIAETEIQGQVKAAYESALQNINLPNEMHYLFQKSLKIGKKVRSEFTLGRGMPDLEHAIYQAGNALFPLLQDVKLLFVGASDVNCKVISFLKSKNMRDITLCNRTIQKAEHIGNEFNLKVLEWHKLHEWSTYDWIIFGTKAPHFLIIKKDISHQSMGNKLIIDLSVPRNVDPKLGYDPRITLFNIDQINYNLKMRKQKMSYALAQAENLINHSVKQYVERFYLKTHAHALLG